MDSVSNHCQDVLKMEMVPTYATSLGAPNVQELVRMDPLQVPERYIRKQEDKPSTAEISYLSSEIPVIDFSLLSMEDEKELNKLDEALQNWGFFQLMNHGVAKEVLQDLKDAAAEFFGLPLEEKIKFSMVSDDIEGYGQPHVGSDDQILDWSDLLVLIVYPSQLRKQQYWPTTPNKFKEIIEAYSSTIRKVGEDLLSSISLLMGMDKDVILGMHKELLQALRINYYPACRKPDQVLGLRQHSDISSITILMQEDDLIGLQIKHGGEWVSVKPIPDTFVVNAGDVLEIWSNGKYKSIEHRAVTNDNKPRISYASFLSPHFSVEIEPIDNMIDPQECSKKYKKVILADYLRAGLGKLEGKTTIQSLKIQT